MPSFDLDCTDFLICSRYRTDNPNDLDVKNIEVSFLIILFICFFTDIFSLCFFVSEGLVYKF